MSGIKCTYPTTNTWRKSNYIEDQRLQKYNKVNEASTNEASNQRIQRTNWTKEDVMIREK